MKPMEADKYKLPPYVVYFLVQANMIGVGIFNFQRELAQKAGVDTWISIVVSGLSVQLLVWMVYKTFFLYKDEQADILKVNEAFFGRIGGWVINTAIALYFFLGAFIIFRRFLEVIELWMFPLMNKYTIALLFLVVIYYAVSGGFHTVAGLSFWGILIPFCFLLILLFANLHRLHPGNLLPLFTHSPKELFQASHSMVFQFLGFEALWLIYPHVETPAKSHRWAQWAVVSSMLLYLLTAIVTFMYYSGGTLVHVRWPLLTMVKIIEIPLYQRMEYFLIAVWFLKVLANMTISLWVAVQIFRKSFALESKFSLPLFLVGFLVLTWLVHNRAQIEKASAWIASSGMVLDYVYIPLLFILVWIRSKWKRKAVS